MGIDMRQFLMHCRSQIRIISMSRRCYSPEAEALIVRIDEELKKLNTSEAQVRPSKVRTFLTMARVLAEQSTCSRRKVGAIFTNEHHHIIASGYNGNAAGMDHCIDKPCAGARLKSGSGLDACEAIHAEQNALIQCKDHMAIRVAYLTTSPCMHCVKMLLNTGCQNIIFIDQYTNCEAEKELWQKSGRKWLHYQI